MDQRTKVKAARLWWGEWNMNDPAITGVKSSGLDSQITVPSHWHTCAQGRPKTLAHSLKIKGATLVYRYTRSIRSNIGGAGYQKKQASRGEVRRVKASKD